MQSWIAEFEAELRRRGFDFTIDAESGRHRVSTRWGNALVSLDNLLKELAADGDGTRIGRFVDAMVASDPDETGQMNVSRFFWCLEPGDHVDKAELLHEVSDRVDRVLVNLSADGSRIAWITRSMLAAVPILEADASIAGFQNLARELATSRVEFSEVGNVRLGFIDSTLAFKSSLILAPNLREVAAPVLGWPLLAVAPDRGFLYLWDAKHKDFVGRVGRTVVKEYCKAAYPISTEVFRIDDEGLKAVGEFPVGT